MTETVFLLQHLHTHPDGSEDVKIIGVYSSEENARQAIVHVCEQPGFVHAPQLRNPLTDEEEDGFYIDAYTLDQDHWTEGFATWSEATGDWVDE